MELREGYKQTEVGLIPQEWSVKRLREFATLATGNTPSTAVTANYGDEFLFVSPADLGESKHITKTEKRLSKKGFKTARRFPKDSILFVCIGSTIGKCGVASVELTSNQQINAIFPTPTFSSDFLYYAACAAAPRVKSLAGEQAVPLVNKTQFSETEVAMPPLHEQRAIATALSDVDALLAKIDQLIAKKRDLKQAAMQQLLTGQTRLPGFSGEWEVKPMKSLGQTYGGLAGKTKEDFGHGSSKYIPFMNVMTDTVIDPDWLESVDIVQNEVQNLAKKGDLFFNGSSETPEEVGFCSVLLEDIPSLYLNSFCFGFRFNKEAKIHGLFFAYWFRCADGRAAMSVLAQGATRYNIAKSAFMRLSIPQPSQEEQVAIATVLSEMDAELAALEARRDKTHALKQGMMQALLTGRIRLL